MLNSYACGVSMPCGGSAWINTGVISWHESVKAVANDCRGWTSNPGDRNDSQMLLGTYWTFECTHAGMPSSGYPIFGMCQDMIGWACCR